jgi:hypothetical protein
MAEFGLEELLDILSGAPQLVRIGRRAYRSSRGAQASLRHNTSHRRSFLKVNPKQKKKDQRQFLIDNQNKKEQTTRERDWTWLRKRWETRGEDPRHLREEREAEEEEGEWARETVTLEAAGRMRE